MLFLETNDGYQGEGQDVEVNPEVQKLVVFWRNELHAPEILRFEEETVNTVKLELEQQQERIESILDKGDESMYFTAMLYQADIDRVRYSLMKYLRARIVKIERQLDHILGDLHLVDCLSSYERVYAKKLFSLNNQFVENTISARLPEDCADFYHKSGDWHKDAQPNLQKFVFCQALARNLVLSTGANETYFSVGDIAVVQYQEIRHYLNEGKMQLI